MDMLVPNHLRPSRFHFIPRTVSQLAVCASSFETDPPGQQILQLHIFKGSAAAADPLEGEVPLVVDMTLRGVDMTLQKKILECQNWGSWWFSRPGTFKERFPGKNDLEW